MTSNLHYCFIKASPARVRIAWGKWTGGATSNAYFVPAQGGCFLVTLKAVAHTGPVAWLQAHTTAIMSTRPEVERFRAAFENGLVR